jgi:hypothetical protein
MFNWINSDSFSSNSGAGTANPSATNVTRLWRAVEEGRLVDVQALLASDGGNIECLDNQVCLHWKCCQCASDDGNYGFVNVLVVVICVVIFKAALR